MKKYILESSATVQGEFKEYALFDKPVYVLNKLPDNVDLSHVLKTIESKIFRFLTDNLENLYVGQFNDFEPDGRHFNALYKDGTIYLSNTQDDNDDMIDDIVHEIAHSLEKSNHEEIYGDQGIEKEFLAKRKYLYHVAPPQKKGQFGAFFKSGV